MTIPKVEVQDSPDQVLTLLRENGVILIRSALESLLIQALGQDLYKCLGEVETLVGKDRLERAGEVGVVRAPLVYARSFRDLASHPSILKFVTPYIGPHSILHLQNGFVLPSQVVTGQLEDEVFQATWHRDFPRILNNFPVSINAFVPLSPFTVETGATQFLLNSHQSPLGLDDQLSRRSVVHAEADPGDVILFDSTIWHRAGTNTSGADRLAANIQFTLPWIKQQMDLWRLFDEEAIRTFPEDVQRLIGYFSRVPDSLDAFYQPPGERYYRSGQG